MFTLIMDKNKESKQEQQKGAAMIDNLYKMEIDEGQGGRAVSSKEIP